LRVGFRVQGLLQLLNLLRVGRLFANRHQSLAASCVVLELRSLPSGGVTRFRRYYEPLRHLGCRPGRSLTGVRLRVTSPHRRGFPCCVCRPFRCMPTPLPRRNCEVPRSFSFPRSGGLPENRVRSASAVLVSRPARRSLHVSACIVAKSPKATLCTRDSGDFVTSIAAPIAYRPERPLPGRTSTC
jgi:hypothetical protein